MRRDDAVPRGLPFCVDRVLSRGVARGAWRVAQVPWADARAFYLVPWKVQVFAPAIVFVTFAGRFTDDETWDLVTGSGMSLLTVGTAWWSIGTMARVVRRKARVAELVVAIAVMFFASSWFYDDYLLLRHGAYTVRWLGNLMLSPTVYLCAGLLTNFEIGEDRKLGFAFTRADWLRPLATKRQMGWPLVLASLPLVVIAALNGRCHQGGQAAPRS